MLRVALLVTSLILAPVAMSVPAAAAGAEQSRTGEECQQRNEGRRRGMGALGAIGRGMLGRFGGSAANIVLPMGSMLGDAIMNLLDCDEQRKAAEATERAVDRGEVGATTTWTSETRSGVTGSSTVTAVDNSGGDDCMTVTDVVIVDGEETRAPKRMCRRPPTNRYVRV
jgi:surface antigen